jgi:hypothetical protein
MNALQGCCLVDVSGQVVTSIEQLPAALHAAKAQAAATGSSGTVGSRGDGGSPSSALPTPSAAALGDVLVGVDHEYPSAVSASAGAPTAVLYAPVGAACGRVLHYALKVGAHGVDLRR